MHEVLVNRLGGLSLPRKSVVRLTDRPDMTLDVYRGRKTTIQQYNIASIHNIHCHDFDTFNPMHKIQSTLIISKIKGLSEILRDTRTSTYQICKNEEKMIEYSKFHK